MVGCGVRRARGGPDAGARALLLSHTVVCLHALGKAACKRMMIAHACNSCSPIALGGAGGYPHRSLGERWEMLVCVCGGGGCTAGHQQKRWCGVVCNHSASG